MPSKLGPHCLRANNGARVLIDAGCQIVKLVDDFGLAPELAVKPGLTLIGRVYASNPRTAEEQQKSGEAPEAAARRFIDAQKEKYRLNPAVKIWEGHNEPVWGSPDEMKWYAAFDAARLKILADLGLRGVIACFATGNPGDIELWKWYLPAVEAAKQHNGILGLHEYSSPWVWWMSGKFQMNPNEDAGDEGWTTLRYRKIMHKYLKPAGLDDIPIAITEFGLDRVSPVPQGASSGNWRTNAGWWSNHNGARDPIDYWRNGGRDSGRYYAEQMIWYDREIRKDPNVLGATIFTLGSFGPPWSEYDIDGTQVVQALADYIRGEANVADPVGAGTTAATSTPTTSTTTTPTSPIVITPPTSGAATGINLLRNASFEEGGYSWHGVPEIGIPNEWDFWHAPHTTPFLPRQDQNFDPPECRVLHLTNISPPERPLFFVSGEHCLKIFKGWGVIWWRLFQNVHGLTPGQRYRFIAPVYPDLVMEYADQGKRFADDPLAGEVRLTVKCGGKETEVGWLDGNQFPFGKYTHFTLDFLAAAPDAEVSIECRGRWGLDNNGWFIDSPRLEAIAAGTSSGTGSSGSAPATGNLLQNANFGGGAYQPNPAIRSLEAPKDWQLWYADEKTAKLGNQTESFRPPRAGVVTSANASPDDKDGLAGNLPQVYRAVGNWRAIWFSLGQKVAVTAGKRYRFTVQLMPDPVDKYGPNGAKQFVAEADGGEVWLKAQSGGQKSETLKRAPADVQPGGYSTFTHEFTAATNEATVTIEVRARYALTQNAWYIASASLVGV